jgi:hypothetical protein
MRRIAIATAGLLAIGASLEAPATARAIPPRVSLLLISIALAVIQKVSLGNTSQMRHLGKLKVFPTLLKGLTYRFGNTQMIKRLILQPLKSEYDVSFVIIKGSDGGTRGNDNAKKWFPIDSAAARAEGLVVGSYHYAQPGNMDSNTITDAKLASSTRC